MAHTLNGTSNTTSTVEQAGLQFNEDLQIGLSSLLRIDYGISVAPLPAIGFGYSSLTVLHSLQFDPNPVVLKSSSHSTGSFYLITSRFCTISGTARDQLGFPAPGATVTCYLKTWGKFVTEASNSTSQLYDILLSTIADGNGNFSFSLIPPGDMSPSNLYYELNVNGYIVRTTSFSHFTGTKDISAVLRNFPTPPTVAMFGNLNDVLNNAISGAVISANLDKSAMEITTGTTILNTRVSTVSGPAGFLMSLIPTDNLAPYGRYYTLNVNNTNPAQTVTVPTTGGLFKNNFVNSSSIVGTDLYSIENVPADVHEPSLITGTPQTVYDSLSQIRQKLVQMTNVPYGTLVQESYESALLNSSNTGSVYLSGNLTTSSLASDRLLSSSTGILRVNIRPEAGLGSRLLPDTFTTLLYGVISWETGLGATKSGHQIEVFRTFDPTLIVNFTYPIPLVTLFPADAGTANYWGHMQCSYSFDAYQTRTGIADTSQIVIYIDFGTQPTNQTTYKVAYSIRGI